MRHVCYQGAIFPLAFETWLGKKEITLYSFWILTTGCLKKWSELCHLERQRCDISTLAKLTLDISSCKHNKDEAKRLWRLVWLQEPNAISGKSFIFKVMNPPWGVRVIYAPYSNHSESTRNASDSVVTLKHLSAPPPPPLPPAANTKVISCCRCCLEFSPRHTEKLSSKNTHAYKILQKYF